jgi:cation transport ATPase
MKHEYQINGMTCNGCRETVEQALQDIDVVQKATVDLQKEKATITMESHLSVEQLQKALHEKYVITSSKNEMDHKQNEESSNDANVQEHSPSKLKQLKPLFLILGYIAIATILLNYPRDNWDGAMLDFMGLFFIVFSFFKILDLKGFPSSFRMYDPLARVMPAYGWIYPFIEVALGLMFLMRFEVDVALVATLVVLGITTIGVTKTLLDDKSIQCACLGTALDLPMTEATFIENAIMIVMASLMLLS